MSFPRIFPPKHSKLIKIAILGAATTSAGWLYYQIKRTRGIINNALDTSILDLMEPPDFDEDDQEKFLSLKFEKERSTEEYIKSIWSSLKFSFAKRLIHLSNNENAFLRNKAIRQLAQMKNLDHWHFQVLQTMINSKTAVGLARTENVDIRLFKDPPVQYFMFSKDMIVEAMKNLLISLHTRSQHSCIGYVISKVFMDVHDVARVADNDSAHVELIKFIQSQAAQHDMLPMCLESLLHHASIGKYGKDIVEFNGLPLLMELHNRFKDNISATATICSIISYLSLDQNLQEELYNTGWITVLANWVKHDDIRISIPASKALANLDSDEKSIFHQRLYLLYPSTKSYRKPAADVIFVHGLLGGVFFTWRQRDKNVEALGLMGKKRLAKEETFSQDSCVYNLPKVHKKVARDPVTSEYITDLDEPPCSCQCQDYEVVLEDVPTNLSNSDDRMKGPFSLSGPDFYHCNSDNECYTYCWPRDWLPEDCPRLRVIGVNYDTNLSLWAPICPSEKVRTLDERCEELMGQLKDVGIGKRPIIWVTHSMGGLMVKNLLYKAHNSDDRAIKRICSNTKGLVFYSTPHVGSNVAKFNQASSLLLWPSIEVQELQENSAKLLEIHENFLKIVSAFPMKIVSFIETKATVVTAMKFKFLVVEPHSGNPGVGEYYEIPQDHLGICKPASRHSFLYQKVLCLIKDILAENKRN